MNIEDSIYDIVNNECHKFDSRTANKKSIRKLRKLLSELSNDKYPRKKKTKDSE